MQNENYTGPDPPDTVEEKLSPEESGDTKMALTDDGTKVKFTNANSFALEDNRNCEAKVDIETVQIAFAGMGKEELMKFANDPFWIRLRWILFILFWLALLAMLTVAIVIIVFAPSCSPLPTLEWWQKNVIYRVDPLSFQDSDGDGKGDLKGIENRLDHFEYLGVKTILLDSIYKAPVLGNATGKEESSEIDPLFGTMEDFESLLKNMKEKDLKLIMDFIPIYTSNQSLWFNKSFVEEPYTDYYVWANGTGPNQQEPPIWAIGNGKGGWKYSPERQQFYRYYIKEDQPMLNLRNPHVKEKLEEMLVFWLSKGVDGFRLSLADYLFEDSNGNDELPIAEEAETNMDHSHHNHSHHEHHHHHHQEEKVILGQNEKDRLLNKWRSILDNYKNEHGGDHRLLLVEGQPSDDVGMKNNAQNVTDSSSLTSLIPTLEFTFFKSSWHLWALGSPTVSRITTRTDPNLIDSFHMFTMLIKGTPITYYGEEIGMQDVDKTLGGNEHALLQNAQRSPMQWNNETNAGFTNSSDPWLPVNPNYQEINVQVQKTAAYSHIQIYKKLVKLRDDPAMEFGQMEISKTNENVIFSRVKKGKPGYVVLINFGDSPQTIDLSKFNKEKSFKYPEDGTVEVRSTNIPESSKLYKMGSGKVKLNNLELGPKEGVVIKFVPNFG